MPQPSITKICLKITCLKFHSNLPGANELMHGKASRMVITEKQVSPVQETAAVNVACWWEGWWKGGRVHTGMAVCSVTAIQSIAHTPPGLRRHQIWWLLKINHGEQTLHRWELVQERRNSSALAMELRVSCTNQSIWYSYWYDTKWFWECGINLTLHMLNNFYETSACIDSNLSSILKMQRQLISFLVRIRKYYNRYHGCW